MTVTAEVLDLPVSVMVTGSVEVSLVLTRKRAVPPLLVAAYARTSVVSPATAAVRADSPLTAMLLKSWKARAVGDMAPKGPAPGQVGSSVGPSEKTL